MTLIKVDTGGIGDLKVTTGKIAANGVTGAKFNADVISGQTELAVAPANTDEFLVSDGGVIKRIDYSLIKGAHTLLGTTTVSSAAADVTFTNSTFTGFDMYFFDVLNMQPSTDNQRPTLQVAGADGTIDTGAIYKFASKGFSSTTSDLDTGDNSANQYRILGDSTQVGSEADEGCNFRMMMYNADSSSVFTQFFTMGASAGSDYVTTQIASCLIFEATTTTKVQFTFDSGNIAAGTFKVYGVT
mgnify:CR=1 FL=1|tara:strand:- start:2276 stop:3004 length:729 start_codon:yes stop_codon:yes gene_type:complete